MTKFKLIVNVGETEYSTEWDIPQAITAKDWEAFKQSLEAVASKLKAEAAEAVDEAEEADTDAE